MNLRIVAVGQDAYWLTAVHQATTELAGDVHTLKCISDLPKPNAETVLLVDASGQGAMEQVVAELRSWGWSYVIVVAADYNAKEAASVLRRNQAYDYWAKTYDEKEIHNKVKTCFEEITAEKKSMQRKPHSFE